MVTETSDHLFWSCQRAREVWQCTKLKFHFDHSQVRSFVELLWLLLMSDTHGEDDAALAIKIMWSIWYNRNEVRHGGRKKRGSALAHWAKQYL